MVFSTGMGQNQMFLLYVCVVYNICSDERGSRSSSWPKPINIGLRCFTSHYYRSSLCINNIIIIIIISYDVIDYVTATRGLPG